MEGNVAAYATRARVMNIHRLQKTCIRCTKGLSQKLKWFGKRLRALTIVEGKDCMSSIDALAAALLHTRGSLRFEYVRGPIDVGRKNQKCSRIEMIGNEEEVQLFVEF